jgi:hypothetical protein
MDFTPEQIAAYKQRHGSIFRYTAADGKSCILKAPTLQVIDACRMFSGGSAIKFDGALVENCWVAGDEEFKNDDAYRLGLFEWLGNIIKKVDGCLEEL